MSAKHFLYALLAATVAVLSLAAAAVSAPPPSISTGPSTAMEMRQHILTALTGRATGFAYAIVKDGRLVIGEGVGKARTGPDGNQNMGRSSRLNVMSVTKTTTAVAILQLLDELNLTVDSRIDKWLPADVDEGPRRLGLRRPLVPPSAHAHVRARAGPRRAEEQEPGDRHLLGERLGRPRSSSSRTARLRLDAQLQQRQLRAAANHDPGALEGDQHRPRGQRDQRGERRHLVPRLRPAARVRAGGCQRRHVLGAERRHGGARLQRREHGRRRQAARADTRPTSTGAAATPTCTSRRSTWRSSWRT